jgi:hypothetical protein
MRALDRRWVRVLVRLATFAASVPAAFLLTVSAVWLFLSGEWGLSHGNGIVVVMIWPILTAFLYTLGHLATSRWPQP